MFVITLIDAYAPSRIDGLVSDNPAPTKIWGPVQDRINADVKPDVGLASWHTVQPAASRVMKDTSRWIPLPYEDELEHEGLNNIKNIHANILKTTVHNYFRIIDI